MAELVVFVCRDMVVCLEVSCRWMKRRKDRMLAVDVMLHKLDRSCLGQPQERYGDSLGASQAQELLAILPSASRSALGDSPDSLLL
jgi:hypothetical protein